MPRMELTIAELNADKNVYVYPRVTFTIDTTYTERVGLVVETVDTEKKLSASIQTRFRLDLNINDLVALRDWCRTALDTLE